ncbi:hypothetical protein OROGR_002835 [Orobanche gracilis]
MASEILTSVKLELHGECPAPLGQLVDDQSRLYVEIVNNVVIADESPSYEGCDKKASNIKSSRSSSTLLMSSSVCCLTSLKRWDQYFLASSMDGSIKLYDHRMIQRGPVQCYEGNVNSHTRIELGVDPSEKVVMSGGEDYYLRLWDIKSGEMLFKERFMNTVPSAVCWPKIGGRMYVTGRTTVRVHGLGLTKGSFTWTGCDD